MLFKTYSSYIYQTDKKVRVQTSLIQALFHEVVFEVSGDIFFLML